MKAKVTKPFSGVADGEVYPLVRQPGEVIAGALAAIAVAKGWADELPETPVAASAGTAEVPAPAKGKAKKAG